MPRADSARNFLRGFGLIVNRLSALQSWKRMVGLCAVVLALAVSMFSQTAGRVNRVRQAANSGGMVTVKGMVHPLTKRATDLGAVNPEMQMESLTLNTSMGAAEQTDLDALLAAQQDPKSPQYHQWLTQEEFGARFGLTEADLNAVTGWLAAQGFTVKGVSKSRNAIYFGGKARQVESAFHTQLHQYKLNGETHFANATELQFPAGIAGVVLNVRGLNDFRLKPKVQRGVAPDYTVDTTNGIVNFLSPEDWATIYDVNLIYSQSCGAVACDGTGMYVGVVGQTYVYPADITNFRGAAGLGAAKVTYACIDPVTAHCTGTAAISTAGDLGEADLDIEWAGGIAKNATVVYVYAPYSDACSNANCTTAVVDPVTENYYGVFDALQRAVQDYTVVPLSGMVLPVISMSYSDCEESFVGQSSYVTWVTTLGQEASSQGQTIVVASGDTGAFGCDYDTYPARDGVSVSVPADSPYYTGVGGTTLSGDESNPTAYWSQTVGLVDSALQYIPETVWNDTSAEAALSASGGGVSLYGGVNSYFEQPSSSNSLWTWNGIAVPQPTPTGYTGTSGRFVPDVAFAASPNHDGYVICSTDNDSTKYGNDCASGFVTSGGTVGKTWDVIGGTSAATPSFAGMLTLMVQKYGAQGNINPKLYNLAESTTNYAKVFHAVTGGNNIVPCTYEATDTGCPTSGEFGYSAVTTFPYYSMTAGLGSIDGYQLYLALGSGTVLATTTTTVPTGLAGMNGTTTLTANVTSGTSGTITGTVTFMVGSTTIATPATISGGVATLSNVAVTAANGFTVGSDTITATYSGDSTFAASSGSGTITVSALPQATMNVSATPNVLAMGGSTTLTATMTPSAAMGGVTFKVGTMALGTATISSGVATLPVTVSQLNGFTTGTNTITATYNGSGTYSASISSITVSLPTYTVGSIAGNAIINAGSSGSWQIGLNSVGYAGTVSFTTSVTASSNGTAADVTASAAPITLTSGGSGTVTLTISPNASATKHAPVLPWKSGGAVIFCTVLLGAPFTYRRRRTLTVLVVAIGVVAAGFMVACGGGGGSSTSTPPATTISTTTGVTATPAMVKLNGTTALAATVTPSAATGNVVFSVGNTTLGTVALASGTATLSSASVSAGNGFSYGTTNTANTVTATYSGNSAYASSSGSTAVTVQGVRTYTITLTPTGSGTVTNPAPVVITVTVP